jgi:hypothetical protein
MDPALRLLIEAGDPADEVAVLVRLAGPGAGPPPGARVISRFGAFATVRTERGQLAAMHARRDVPSIKAGRLYRAEVEPGPAPAAGNAPAAGPVTAADLLRRPERGGPTGRGVVIGIVDWGLDVGHPAFRRADGGTRLLALWDQQPGPDPAAPNRFGYGRIHYRDAIDAAMGTDDPFAALRYDIASADGGTGCHGTATASVAAGSPWPGGVPGAAPDAELVFVHLSTAGPAGPADLGDSTALVEALDFIREVAAGRPCVVNLSLGRCCGPHDGNTLVELVLDAAGSGPRPLLVVQSCGNYRQRRAHTEGAVRAGGRARVPVRLPAGAPGPHEVELWYSGADSLAVGVRPPGGAPGLLTRPGQDRSLNLPDGSTVRVLHRWHDPNNGRNQVTIRLPATGRERTWRLEIAALDVVDGRFHAWIERRPAGDQAAFPEPAAVPRTDTGTICNGLRSLAVGGYDPAGSGSPIAAFSSGGPTVDGRHKPDLLAPAVDVLVARSRPVGAAADRPWPYSTRMSGTSLASPHVTGAVACLLEDGADRPGGVRTALLSTCRPYRGTDPARAGCGYLDLTAALDAVRTHRDNQEAAMSPHLKDMFDEADPESTVIVRDHRTGRDTDPAGGTFTAPPAASPPTASGAFTPPPAAPPSAFDPGPVPPPGYGYPPAPYPQPPYPQYPYGQPPYPYGQPAYGYGYGEPPSPYGPPASAYGDPYDSGRTPPYPYAPPAPYPPPVPYYPGPGGYADPYADPARPWPEPAPEPPAEQPAEPDPWAIEPAAPPGAEDRPGAMLASLNSSATELVDAYVFDRRPDVVERLAGRVTLVAGPCRPVGDAAAGDLLVRGQVGEGQASLAVLADSELLDFDAARDRGWLTEGELPGRYALVLEDAPPAWAAAGPWARRVADAAGFVPTGQALLRLEPAVPADVPATEDTGGAPEPTLADWIALIRRVEAAHPNWTALRTAQALMRTKFYSRAFNWLLPSTANMPGVTVGGPVTAADVAFLGGRAVVTLPDGRTMDSAHVVTGIVAAAERQSPGSGGAGGSLAGVIIQPLPPDVTQLDVATWIGDVGSAAANWAVGHPIPSGGTTQADYVAEFAPDSDLIGDVDGIVMARSTAGTGFAFDYARPLSDNLARYYGTRAAPGTGASRRMHAFCAALGLTLKPDGVTLSDAAGTDIDARVQRFTDWFSRNDPTLLASMVMASAGQVILQSGLPMWVSRAGDWRWFAAQFKDFLQRYLRLEGPAAARPPAETLEVRPPGPGERSAFDRRAELIDRLNALSTAIRYSLDGRAIRYEVLDPSAVTYFDREMQRLIDLAEVIPMRLINRTGLIGGQPLAFDSFQEAYVDLDDLLASSDLGFQLVMLHFLTERAQVRDYARLIGTDLHLLYPKAHRAGLEAQAALLRAVLADNTIEYRYDEMQPNGNYVYGFHASGYWVFQVNRNAGATGTRGSSVFVQLPDKTRLTVPEMQARRAAAAPATAPTPTPTPAGGGSGAAGGGSETPPSRANVPVIARIFELVEASGLVNFSWKERGPAPKGYLKGMALTYARVYCHYTIQPGESEDFRDRFAVKMTKGVAPGASTVTDAVAKYKNKFMEFGADVKIDGVHVLRALFTILFSLGMRESGGKYCAGWDTSKTAGPNPKAPTATNSEAGLFQISYDIGVNAGDFRDLYERYKQRPDSGFLDVFSEGVTCNVPGRDGGAIFGAGVGREFQQFSKDCPAFTVELAALGLRTIANHWGPINVNTVEIRRECWSLMLEIEKAIDRLGGCVAFG